MLGSAILPRFATRLCSTLVLVCTIAACRARRTPVVVMVASSATRAFAEVERQSERQYPKLDLQLEISGSQVACRKVAELQRHADLVAVADYQVIDRILRPGHARFNLRFATNAVVLAHMEHSKHTDIITADNLSDITSVG